MSLPASYLKFCGNLLLFVVYFFAIPHHLFTFFTPFKRMSVTSSSPGVHLAELGEVISFNLVSLGIGMMIRAVVIVMGILVLLCAVLSIIISLPFFLLLLPLLKTLDVIRTQKEEKALAHLIASAKVASGTTLRVFLTKDSLGRFITRKLAVDTKELSEVTRVNSEFPLSAEPLSKGELFLTYCREFAPLKAFLESKKLDGNDCKRIIHWYEILTASPLPFLENSDNLKKIRGIGATWSYGYTNELEKYQVRQHSSPFSSLVGRDKELDALSQVLSKTSHNSAIVAGSPGIGRHAIVDEFVRTIYRGGVDPHLASCRVIYLDLNAVLAGDDLTTSRQRVASLCMEGRQAGNIILVIDDIDKFLETAGERIDLTDIFNQYLSDGRLRIIGLTSTESYNRYVSQNETLQKLFVPIIVSPPDLETVYLQMELSIVPILEYRHKVEISYIAIKKAITNADRFLSSTPFPEKAINLMDETIIFTKKRHPHMKLLWDDDIELYLSEKINVPIGTLTQKDKDKLASLEADLHKRVVGQDEAIVALARALRRSVLEISDPKKPIGSFLFLGPTGSGKTETAKALAAGYFGSDSRLVRFDMSQYQGEDGLTKLIGSQARNTPGQLTSAIANNPFSVILLDEIEKAPPIVLNLFLTLLDEGYLSDAFGRQVSAKQCIIIGTSNAGALFIKNQVLAGLSGPSLAQKLLEYVQSEKLFSPEFLNRFDGVIVFKPLSFEEIKVVTELMLAALQKRLAQKQIPFTPSPLLVEQIIKEGYDPAFGARSIKRYIQDTVEDEVSKSILATK